MHRPQEKTFEKNLEKARAKTVLRKLGACEFVCEPNARIAAEKWLEEHPGFRFSSLDIATISRRMEKRRGRPKNDEPVVLSYRVDAEIELERLLKRKDRKSGDLWWSKMGGG
ncbi:hypothetical protein CUJ86_02650 [Methanofollis fontis]|uniref:Uncharacterized protein n=1 Tax=Methanofollis fontis TaxID=2052832 RepID=A0A483CVG2_9EURY|nr:hypothetical protein [Methanofollis fontis]TAJ45636.1 hypothetical protein CUJ86_02650 [Methanofollis fontis]